MHGSIERYMQSQDPVFQNRVLILALRNAQEIMNQPTNGKDQAQARLQAKAVEVLNQPEQFRERLSLSVAAFMDSDDVLDSGIDDADLMASVIDAFDGIAGITPPAENEE